VISCVGKAGPAYLLSAVVGIAAAGQAYVLCADRLPAGVAARVALLATIGACAAALMRFFVIGFAARLARRRLPEWYAALPSLTLLAAAVLQLLRPVALPAFPVNPPREIRVCATGNKNPAAHNREIWFRGVVFGNGKRILATEFDRDGNWYKRGDALLSTGHPVACATWRGRISGTMRLLFDANTHAGIVRIERDGEVTKHDLYTSNAKLAEIALELPTPYPLATRVYRAVLLASVVIVRAVALYVGALLLGLALVAIVPAHGAAGTRRWPHGSIRIAAVLLVFGYAFSQGRQSGAFSLRGYWEGAWEPAKRRNAPWRRCVMLRAFFKKHIPRGDVVLADPVRGTELVEVWDCHIMHQLGGIRRDLGEPYFTDYQFLKSSGYGWSDRRPLLQRNNVRWVYCKKSFARKNEWLDAVAIEVIPHSYEVLYHLPPPEDLPAELDIPEDRQ
jgi:hypothetical protein